MREDYSEELCARLCLLTHTAWDDSLPRTFTRAALQALDENAVLDGLVLREPASVPQKTLLRARLLLTRTTGVFEQIQQYEKQGYCGLVRKSSNWPDALHVLRKDEPHFLFAKGNQKLLKTDCVAVAGSRIITEETAVMAARLGRMMAEEKLTMVCGGANGVDTAAQNAILDAGGNLIIVPAVSAEKVIQQEREKRALDEGRLLVLCDALPDSPFSSHKALGRNHTIYALGRAAIVVASRNDMGGSWRGAIDCLKGGFSPVFAPDEPWADCDGNRALYDCGASPIDLSGKKTIKGQIRKKKKAVSKR